MQDPPLVYAGKIAIACIQPVYTSFRSVLNKSRWRLGPPSDDYSMGWILLLEHPKGVNSNTVRGRDSERHWLPACKIRRFLVITGL